MAKLMIVANAAAPQVRERGVIGLQAGYEIHWYSQNPATIEGVNLYSLPKWVRTNFLLRVLIEPFVLAFHLWNVKPDLVHVHYASKGLAAIPLAFQPKLIVSTMGGDILPCQDFVFPYKFWIKLLLQKADIVTGKTWFFRERLAEMGIGVEKFRMLAWGLDTEEFSPNRKRAAFLKELDIAKGSFVVFDPRSAFALYNKDIILRAFAKAMPQIKRPVVLLSASFTGSEEYVAELQTLAKALGIEKEVRFLGKIEHAEMADYYGLADVTLSVPSSDGMPQTIYEALACGSFLIVGNLPQYDGVINERESGIRVAPRNVEELTEALVWAAEQSDLRERTLAAGRGYVEKHANKSIENARMLAIYRELLDEHA